MFLDVQFTCFDYNQKKVVLFQSTNNTIPRRENFTGKFCTESFGGKTCHIFADSLSSIWPFLEILTMKFIAEGYDVIKNLTRGRQGLACSFADLPIKLNTTYNIIYLWIKWI